MRQRKIISNVHYGDTSPATRPSSARAQTVADLLSIENVSAAQSVATELMATNGRGVLWILDGWDELPTHLQ